MIRCLMKVWSLMFLYALVLRIQVNPMLFPVVLIIALIVFGKQRVELVLDAPYKVGPYQAANRGQLSVVVKTGARTRSNLRPQLRRQRSATLTHARLLSLHDDSYLSVFKVHKLYIISR